ncbi:hypothetical protein DERF_008819 [Dermatophagoides farinae]|uniref:Uncharacterized protein n=1 Tax=Dermatophagoides farinae TaxID=6954 RepID=A0A922I478_DERFA|nr:hypothetical protein DERF_008819 [Dermatophagoides farinae]
MIQLSMRELLKQRNSLLQYGQRKNRKKIIDISRNLFAVNVYMIEIMISTMQMTIVTITMELIVKSCMEKG